MSGTEQYQTLDFTATFLRSLVSQDFSAADRRRFLRALELLDTNERHPSLRVHQLQGPEEGIWSASASDELRVTFLRREGGRKLMLTCSRHYRR
jgi:mRNA-degrading endonuclease YafQ of YafQ-DinJ toxin-antitoxin module